MVQAFYCDGTHSGSQAELLYRVTYLHMYKI